MTPAGTGGGKGSAGVKERAPRQATRPRQGRSRMDPRISARRTTVIKQQGRRRLIALGVALGVTALLVGAWFLVHTPLFSARSVTVTGNVHESAAQVVAQAGLSSQPPLLDVNAGAAAARIEQLPWVRSATVHVEWPDGVHIAVVEETARFTAGTPGGQWGSLSADGRVLGESPTRPPGLLLLTVPQPPGAPGTVLAAKDASGLRVASSLPASFAAQVTAVTVEPAGWVQLALTTPDRGRHRDGDRAHGQVRGRLVHTFGGHPAQWGCHRRQRPRCADGGLRLT